MTAVPRGDDTSSETHTEVTQVSSGRDSSDRDPFRVDNLRGSDRRDFVVEVGGDPLKEIFDVVDDGVTSCRTQESVVGRQHPEAGIKGSV